MPHCCLPAGGQTPRTGSDCALTGTEKRKTDPYGDQCDEKRSAYGDSDNFSFYSVCERFYVHMESMIHYHKIVNTSVEIQKSCFAKNKGQL